MEPTVMRLFRLRRMLKTPAVPPRVLCRSRRSLQNRPIESGDGRWVAGTRPATILARVVLRGSVTTIGGPPVMCIVTALS